MIKKISQTHRILAVDPTSKGFGFVVLEENDKLVDWGLREVHGDKNANCLRRIAILIKLYTPALIVLEDLRHGSRRCDRVRKLILKIQTFAQYRRVPTRKINKVKLRQAFSPFGASTKDAIA